MMAGVCLGRIVRYVIPDDSTFKNYKQEPVAGTVVPAIIVGLEEDGSVNLQTFYNAPGIGFWNNVRHSPGKESGTWHFPERVE